MSLQLRTNDLTWHGGFYFLLRDTDQQPMMLDVTRGATESYSLLVHDGRVWTEQGESLCNATTFHDGIIIEKPGCLMTVVWILRTFNVSQIQKIGTAQEPTLLMI